MFFRNDKSALRMMTDKQQPMKATAEDLEMGHGEPVMLLPTPDSTAPTQIINVGIPAHG